MKVVVAQKGSREHFLLPRALHRQGMLARLVVDWYTPFNGRVRRLLARTGSQLLERAMGANSPDIPRDLVTTMNWRAIAWRAKNFAYSRRGRPYDGHIATDAAFAKTVAGLRLPPHEVFIGYSYASLEAIKAERDRGVVTIVDQIDPGRVEFDLVCEECKRWPDYVNCLPKIRQDYHDRAKQEWSAADVVIVNSDWTRQALIQQGCDSRKLELLPLAYEPSNLNKLESGHNDKKLQVLWLGNVIIRKGIQYLVEAARLLVNEPVQFLVAGPIGIRKEAVAAAPNNIDWLGLIPRPMVSKLYCQGDIFIFPTLSDGFGITQLEALAHGLPVITTPNCGRVVEEGQTGFIVPPRSPEAIAEAVMQFVRSPDLAPTMSSACVVAARRYSVASYADQLVKIIRRHKEKQNALKGKMPL